jgi:hypothetical protein
MKTLWLRCSCCGDTAPAHKQWANRDTGYGCCARCFTEIFVAKYGMEEAVWLHGKPGIHHSISTEGK